MVRPDVIRLLQAHIPPSFSFFFFNDTATTEIYTLSLHDALPISRCERLLRPPGRSRDIPARRRLRCQDRKSTRLNSSHGYISYAVFCLKKKKTRPIARDYHRVMLNIGLRLD